MATFTASVAAVSAGAANAKPNATLSQGKVRMMISTITVAAGSAIADVIQWGTLPNGARVLGNMSKLYYAAGAASSTLNLGDATTPARYLAATAVNAAGSAIAEAANASGALFANSADTVIQSVVAGAGLQTGQVITLHLAYITD